MRLTQKVSPSKKQVFGLLVGHPHAPLPVQTASRGQVPHWPEQHLPFLHTLPHAPQLKSFVLGSTHFPPQSVVPPVQTHLPTTHVPPDEQSASVQQPSSIVHRGKPPAGSRLCLMGRNQWCRRGNCRGAFRAVAVVAARVSTRKQQQAKSDRGRESPCAHHALPMKGKRREHIDYRATSPRCPAKASWLIWVTLPRGLIALNRNSACDSR